MEETAFSMTKLLALGVFGLVVIALGFGIIYWLLGRGGDGDGTPRE
jgi:hypothetical protein